MNRWDGWSVSWGQVHLTQVLATLLDSVIRRRTCTTIGGVLDELALPGLSPAAVATTLLAEPAPFLLVDPRRPADDQQLKLTAAGARLAAEFRANHETLARFRVAQRTVLRCCSAHPATEFLPPVYLLQEPLSWFYGRQLHLAELRRACAALATSGLLFMVGDELSSVVQLTALGLLCVQRYDSDPRQMPPH